MTHDHSYSAEDRALIESYIERFDPLNEMHYKDILADVGGPLPHKDYLRFVKLSKYVGCKGSIMKFFVPNEHNGWNTFFQFVQWNAQRDDTSLSAPDAARLLLWGADIRMHCTCPAYRFYGMQYIDTQLGMAIVPENRVPSIRNPHLLGTMCKHLRKVVPTLGFHLGDMASAIKSQRDKLGIKYIPLGKS